MLAAIGALLAPYAVRLIAAGVVVAAVAVGFVILRSHYINTGYRRAIADVAAQDKGALDAVRKATSAVDDCNLHGGRWDTTRGVCASN